MIFEWVMNNLIDIGVVIGIVYGLIKFMTWYKKRQLCKECGKFIKFDHEWNSCKCEKKQHLNSSVAIDRSKIQNRSDPDGKTEVEKTELNSGGNTNENRSFYKKR